MLRIGTKPLRFIPKWNNNDKDENPLSMDLLNINYSDFWSITVLMQRFQRAVTEEASQEKSKNIIEIIEELKPIACKYIKNIDNFEINGSKGSIEDIFDQPGLLFLAMEILTKLMEISMPTETDKKK